MKGMKNHYETMENIMGKSQELYEEAKTLIPGGTQLLSKRPEMFAPNLWPAYYSRAKGCRVWDLDDNEYIDMSYMGIGSCIIGYADDRVDDEVKRAIDLGNMSTLNAPEEVELAKKLCSLHPWAKKVRYARSGGESMAVAVRIARSYTQRDIILFCGYHGWHDWYLAANLSDDKALDGHLLPGLSPRGVPRGLSGTAYPFKYNDTESFLELVERYGDRIAAVVMEPIRSEYPQKEFISTIEIKTKEIGAVLIVDEITAGWRLCVGGAHLILGINPDIAVFGKAISNGFPMGAIIGKSEIMEAAQDTFISSTYWTDRLGFAASLKTIELIEEYNIPKHLEKVGKAIQDGWKQVAKETNIKIEVEGIYPLSHFSFKYENSKVLETIFIKLMLKRGYLSSSGYYASFAHSMEDIEKYLETLKEVFMILSSAIKEDRVKEMLDTPIKHNGFERLT